MRHLAAVTLTLCLVLSQAIAVDVNIDLSTHYQTMEGMGAMNRISPWKVKVGPFYQDVPLDNFYDSLVNVMGFTMLRPTEGCEFSPSAGVYSASALRGIYGHYQQLKAVADASNEPFMACPAVFSPPPYLKGNGLCVGEEESTHPSNPDNTVLPEYYDDFGEVMVKYLEYLRDSLGIDAYALSLQNEPFFNEPYASCTYANGSHYAQMLAVAGPIIRAAGLNTILYGAEHMAWAFPSWENAIMDNAGAAPYLDRFAVHGYTDGVEVDTSTFTNIMADGARPLWMSETGGSCETYSDGMTIGRTIMRSFNNGLSAWLFCGLIGGVSSCGWLVSNGIDGYEDGTPGPAYWAHAHFARFARPGWKRIACQTGDGQLMVSAYADVSGTGVSVVIINNASGTRSVDLVFSGGSAPTEFTGKQTTDGAYFADLGTVGAGTTLSLPANSITSLGYNHIGTKATAVRHVQQYAASRSAPVRHMQPARLFDLRGRSLGTPHRMLNAHRASIVVVPVDARGVVTGQGRLRVK